MTGNLKNKRMEKIILLGVGIIDLYLAGRFLMDTNFARKYVLESPKALIWRKMWGPEMALTITRYIFAPMGIILGITLVLFGLGVI